ncbi:MAG: hypothetical protein GWO79_00755 [Actinobacteria bacterium]|nr:hypothetical protein [Actinomycetota bacterium]
MPKDVQSIEDLIGRSAGVSSGDDDSAQSQFTQKSKEIKVKEMERATERKAADLGASYVDLTSFSISPEALTLIREEDSAMLSVVCFFYDGKDIRLGTTDYSNPAVNDLLKKLEKKRHARGVIYLISEHSLSHALELYKAIPKPRKIIRGINITEEDLDKYSEKFSSFRDVHEQIESARQVTDIVTVIMAAAVKTGSSDVHIEVEEKDIKVRFRIDGVLHNVASIRKEMWDKIVLRFKILTKVKINISNKPQDGRMSIFMKNDRIDIRASFLPTAYGESVVMRLLRSSAVGLSFEDLGIRSRAFKQLKREVERPNGMIITTGPTGSGKTTTLYAVLKKLNNPETKIITIEDPIEYQLNGVNQSQTSEKYTFAHGLRSIVRQDPDIVMVGEIRDLETAEIAVQAALTGHLVLSTIHTNNAAGTVPRFLSMGAKPFLLAPALNAIIGQRLVRRVCEKCKREEKADDETMARVKDILEKLPEEERKGINLDSLKFYKGAGCDACQDIGYKGRIGIYEIMAVNKEIEKIILSGKVSEYDMAEVAVKNGMVTMVQDGLLKVIDGITSVEEVFRVAEMKE